MNITTESNIEKNEKVSVNSRTLIIRNQKKKLMTVKPVIDKKYGNVYQQLYLNDYVIYALLRNKLDFTSCSSTNRALAIELAKEFQNKIEKYLSAYDKFGEATADLFHLPEELKVKYGTDKKEVITQLLYDIKESFKRLNKLNLTNIKKLFDNNLDSKDEQHKILKKEFIDYIDALISEEIEDKQLKKVNFQSFENLVRFLPVLTKFSNGIYFELEENGDFAVGIQNIRERDNYKSILTIYFNENSTCMYCAFNSLDGKLQSKFSGTADIANPLWLEKLFHIIDLEE